MAQIELTPVRDRGASLRIAATDSDEHPVAAKAVAARPVMLSAAVNRPQTMILLRFESA